MHALPSMVGFTAAHGIPLSDQVRQFVGPQGLVSSNSSRNHTEFFLLSSNFLSLNHRALALRKLNEQLILVVPQQLNSMFLGYPGDSTLFNPCRFKRALHQIILHSYILFG